MRGKAADYKPQLRGRANRRRQRFEQRWRNRALADSLTERQAQNNVRPAKSTAVLGISPRHHGE